MRGRDRARPRESNANAPNIAARVIVPAGALRALALRA